MELFVNAVVSDIDTGSKYLVLWLAPDNTYGYWLELTSRKRIPSCFAVGDLSECGGRYELSAFMPDQTLGSMLLSEKERSRRDHTWNIIRNAIENEPAIYEAKSRINMLRAISNEHGVCIDTLYDYLGEYWQSGKTRNAFLPNWRNCGGKG